jgi:hypothetical protein
MKIGKLAVAALLIGGTLASQSNPASAINPDNKQHQICRRTSYNLLITGYNHGLAQMQSLSGWGPDIRTNNCGDDVNVYDVNSGPGVAGVTYCTNWVASSAFTRCDVMSVDLNRAVLGTDVTKWKSTACHELGHTVSLSHNTRLTSCMYTNTNAYPLYFDSSDNSLASATWAVA